MSRELHPIDGNGAVLEETKGRDNLHPSWAVLPPRSGELAKPAALVGQMISNGVRAAKLFYGSYTFPISEWCIGELLDELEAHLDPPQFWDDAGFAVNQRQIAIRKVAGGFQPYGRTESPQGSPRPLVIMGQIFKPSMPCLNLININRK
jgi:hypothetical protein